MTSMNLMFLMKFLQKEESNWTAKRAKGYNRLFEQDMHLLVTSGNRGAILATVGISRRQGRGQDYGIITGSQIVIECLKEQGVDTVFGYPGGAILNVYDAII